MQEVVVRYSEGSCNFLGNRQDIGEGLIGQFMKLDCMFLRNHQTMSVGKRLNVQECVATKLTYAHFELLPFSCLDDFEGRDFTLDDTAEDARHA